MLDRRSVLTGAGALLLGSKLTRARSAPADALQLGPARAFSFESLVREAQTRAARPFAPDRSLPQDVLDRIDYAAHGRIRFRTDHALFRDGPGDYPVTFFALGRFFRTPVHMFALSSSGADAQAREILYDPGHFDMPADSPARELGKAAGFAGFRVQESRHGDPRKLDWRRNDWVAFLGASYFRAIGELYQYGISARGIAIDVALADRPEEFPSFTRFYFVPPSDGATALTVYALLEGPSLTGAYCFDLQRQKAVLMDIDARLFLRRDIARLGIAPMSSMFWFSETAKPGPIDWRPEVHDSDGLGLWTGGGERIWRPLHDAQHTAASAFADRAPKGFGLLQRDRVFDHYLDGVHYERRPSLWVEPLEDWGEGSVQLIELPTDDEIQDNIVAMWVPKQPTRAGAHLALRYRLYWSAEEPHPGELARCVATRIGRGGEPGQVRPNGVIKFMVEFLGGPLASLPYGVKPEPVLTASHGTFSYVFTEAVPDGVAGHWRAQFDYTPASTAVAELRLYLKSSSQTLSETWLYQHRALEA